MVQHELEIFICAKLMRLVHHHPIANEESVNLLPLARTIEAIINNDSEGKSICNHRVWLYGANLFPSILRPKAFIWIRLDAFRRR